MNNKNVLNSMRIIILGLVLSLGVSYVSAIGTFHPPVLPPANNTVGPLNVGSSTQTKTGSLVLGGADVGTFTTSPTAGNLRVSGGFLAKGPSEFDDKVYVGGTYQGSSGSQTGQAPSFLAKLNDFLGISTAFALTVDPYTLTVYGKTNLTDDTQILGGATVKGDTAIGGSATIGGNNTVAGNITSSVLAGSSGFTPVCVNSSGKLVLCPQAGCGSAAGVPVPSAPTTHLCTTGNTASSVTGSGPWNWTCTSPTSVVANCQAPDSRTCQGTYVSNPAHCTGVPSDGGPDTCLDHSANQTSCNNAGCSWFPTVMSSCSTFVTHSTCTPSGCSWQ
jgi:hypothetical protein